MMLVDVLEKYSLEGGKEYHKEWIVTSKRGNLIKNIVQIKLMAHERHTTKSDSIKLHIAVFN